MLQLEDEKRAIVNPYKSLKDISEVKSIQGNGKDKAMMGELYQVLRKYDAVDRVGVNLLHDHFSLVDSEVLIETHNAKTRTLTIKPYRNIELKEGESLKETNWRFGDNGEIIAMQLCIDFGVGHVSTEVPYN